MTIGVDDVLIGEDAIGDDRSADFFDMVARNASNF
jgi:hypothetical protein